MSWLLIVPLGVAVILIATWFTLRLVAINKYEKGE